MATCMDVNRVIYSSHPVKIPPASSVVESVIPDAVNGASSVAIATSKKSGPLVKDGGVASGPLCHLYFCRHCLKLRSGTCVSHEVDSHYCPNCLENMASGEAKMKKNRCNTCFDCPSCHHTLSTRATTVPSGEVDQDGHPVTKKAFYLACGFCRWTSRDVGIKDQFVSSGGWKDQENVHEKRIATLLAYYRQLALKEKAEKEKKRYTRRKGYYQLSDKFGLSSIVRKRSGLLGSLSKDMEEVKIQEVERSIASDVVDELPDSYYTQPLVLAQVTTIAQRLGSPEFQPSSANELYPRHKQLLIKRSQRCKECDHNLSKPDYNPSSIKFKIQLVAVHHIPEIRIMSLPNFKLNQLNQVILTIVNPLDFLCHVTLLPRDPDSDNWSNAKVDLPVCELLLSRSDDSAEFDDSLVDAQQSFDDDLSVVTFRKANKLGFFITVTPRIANEDVKISFRLKHDYQTMASSIATERDPAAAAPEFIWLDHIVSINLGRQFVA